MTAPFASKMRPHFLQNMEQAPLDLLIIGGGITGAGIALDAAARGMRVGLIDMQDYAAGTSSRSTKLVHGGLRYLKQLDIGVVAEVGKERAIVYENGPHVTTPEWMLLPIYKEGTFGRFSTALGLKVYDFLAGVKREERRQMLNAAETLAKEPLLRREGLQGGGYYVEYRTDDARLTLEVLKEAVAHGALAVNYARLERFSYEDGRAVGAEIADVLSGRLYKVKARRIVNAAGPWVDTLRELDGSKQGKRLLLTKGIHLVVDQSRFPLGQAVYFDTPDGRMMFAIPRDGKAYVGTTDTEYTGDMMHPRMADQDRQYVLDALNGMFPDVRITEEDIESSWAGIRPLIHQEGKGPSEISRKDEIWQSESGLITIAGGKLTGYRKMAETVVDRVAAQLEAQLEAETGRGSGIGRGGEGRDGENGGRRQGQDTGKGKGEDNDKDKDRAQSVSDSRGGELSDGSRDSLRSGYEGAGGFDNGAPNGGVQTGGSLGSGKRFRPCRTKELPISGGHVGRSASFQSYVEKKTLEGIGLGLPRELAAQWAACYGSNVDRLFELVREMWTDGSQVKQALEAIEPAGSVEAAEAAEASEVPETSDIAEAVETVETTEAAYQVGLAGTMELSGENDFSNEISFPDGIETTEASQTSGSSQIFEVIGLPLEVSVPLRYAMEHEMAVTLEDFFVRRTGALLFDIDWVKKWKGPTAAYMASYLGWSVEEQARYLEQLEKQLHNAVVPEDAAEEY